ELLVNAQGLRGALRESLDHLHRRETRLQHQLHLPVLEKALDEEVIGGAAAVGAEGDANTGVGKFLEVDLVDLESSLVACKLGILRWLFPLLSLENRQPLCGQTLVEKSIVDPCRRFSVHEH